MTTKAAATGNPPPGEKGTHGRIGLAIPCPYRKICTRSALCGGGLPTAIRVARPRRGPEPASVRISCFEEYGHFIETNGTHSILDVIEVVPAEDTDQLPGTIRPLTSAETQQLFGTTEPSHADYTRLADALLFHKVGLAERGTGRAVTLWEDGVPTEIAFWGYSGD